MKSCTLAPATAAALKPPQFSLPHSPVANAHVTVFRLVGITFNSCVSAPVTAVLLTFVFQSRVIVISLYGLKMNPLAVPPPPPPVPPPPPPVPPPPPPFPEPVQAPSEVHGWPVPTPPLWVAGSSPWVHQFAW